jgi:hypothetical protein
VSHGEADVPDRMIENARVTVIAAFLFPLIDAAKRQVRGTVRLVTGEAPCEARLDLPLEVIVQLVAEILLHAGWMDERPQPEDDRAEQLGRPHR